jgi:LCP family protein required for cell wall assembly
MRARRVAERVLRAAVVLVAAAVLAATGFAWSTLRTASAEIVTSDALGERAPAGVDEPLDRAFTALLVGIDSRTDSAGNPLPPEVLAQLRAGEDEGQFNTDTIILLHVPAGPDASASAISIPRDSYVAMAADGRPHKINSAYRRGMQRAADAAPGLSEQLQREAGRQELVRTVERLTGVPIDHFAEVNLAGFVELTEVLGGVPVCLNAPVREERSGVDLPAGYQTVSGADALAFVRQRRDLPGGDLDRVTRQQAFLAGVARSAITGTLTDPGALDRLVRTVTRYVVLDRGWDLDELLEQLRRAAGRDITFRTIPTGRPDLDTPADGIAVEVDQAEVAAFVQAVVGGAGTPGSSAPTTTPTTAPVPSRAGSTAGLPTAGAPTTGPSAAPSTTAPTTPPSSASASASAATPVPTPALTAATVPCVD